MVIAFLQAAQQLVWNFDLMTPGNVLHAFAFALLMASPAVALDCPAGMRDFLHVAGRTCVPENPQRIVTLQDQNALLPLLELGVRPVGSAGHLQPDGSRIFRRTSGFDTEAIAFVGSYRQPDIEAVAALRPDLIVTSGPADAASARYSAIAPTVVIDVHLQPLEAALMRFAELVGRTAEAEQLRRETVARAEIWRERLGDKLDRTTISAVTRWGDGATFNIMPPVHAWGAVRRLLDPVMSAPERADDPQALERSFEALGMHAADVMVFVSFDGDDADGAGSFSRFVDEPLVRALPVSRAGQLVELDGTRMIGAGWTRIREGVDQLGAVLAADSLERDLVVE